jgi:phage gp45-like
MIGAIRKEVRRQLNIILSGAAGSNASTENETINALYPGSPQISDRPVMHPYGLASRAPAGKIQVTARQGSDPQNRIVLGHRDDLRSGLGIESGETMIYASDGKTVLASIKLGSTGVAMKAKTFSVTNDTTELLASVVQCLLDIGSATTVTMLGNQPLVMPTFVNDLEKVQTFLGGT